MKFWVHTHTHTHPLAHIYKLFTTVMTKHSCNVYTENEERKKMEPEYEYKQSKKNAKTLQTI